VDVDLAEERDRINRQTARVLAIAFGAVGFLFFAFVAAVVIVGQIGGSLSPREAMDRCTATPYGFPERLDGASISTTWGFWPPGWVCVYTAPGSSEQHPANADCLTSPGWCEKP
jgi:hypothetical protein